MSQCVSPVYIAIKNKTSDRTLSSIFILVEAIDYNTNCSRQNMLS